MPPTLSKYLVNPKVLGAVATAGAVLAGYVYYSKRKAAVRTPSRHGPSKKKSDGAKEKEKPAVDMNFLRRLYTLLQVLIPGPFTPEVGYLLLVAVALVVRTYGDVWMIQNGTSIESAIISQNLGLFKQHFIRYLLAMPVVSLVSNLVKYGLNELKLRFRARLSVFLYSKYMRGHTLYKMANLDKRIDNADQLFTQDVVKLCNTIPKLYSNITKPLLDISMYVYKLSGSIGTHGPLVMLAYVIVSGFVLTRLRAPMSLLTAKEQQLEGKLRYVHSRLVTNSEEISFYQGNNRERITLERTFHKLVDHLRKSVLFGFGLGVVDTVTSKYMATLVGYLVVSLPFLGHSDTRLLNDSHESRMMEYYRSGRMLVRMAGAVGRLVLAVKETNKLAGLTARVSELIVVLDDMEKGAYNRPMIATRDDRASNRPWPLFGTGEMVEMDHIISTGIRVLQHWDQSVAALGSECCSTGIRVLQHWDQSVVALGSECYSTGIRVLQHWDQSVVALESECYSTGIRVLQHWDQSVAALGSECCSTGIRVLQHWDQSVTALGSECCSTGIRVLQHWDQSVTALGSECYSTGIRVLQHWDQSVLEYRFEGVTLATPNRDVLVRNLSFEVRSGMNVLVCGPNGCGKSSLFRTLGELWPLCEGRVIKPNRNKLFYIPQRPYMTLGSLRDQVIYPDTPQDQKAKGITDEQLEEYLKKVQLSYLLEREKGWETEQDWMDLLSGGEKQRMAMARLFYHEPQFAILDECTSAVSVDVEGFIYTHCRERGITLFTVSHRKSLWKYHEYVLQFDGHGHYEFKSITSSSEEFGS
eukprot:Em0011g587a